MLNQQHLAEYNLRVIQFSSLGNMLNQQPTSINNNLDGEFSSLGNMLNQQPPINAYALARSLAA